MRGQGGEPTESGNRYLELTRWAVSEKCTYCQNDSVVEGADGPLSQGSRRRDHKSCATEIFSRNIFHPLSQSTLRTEKRTRSAIGAFRKSEACAILIVWKRDFGRLRNGQGRMISNRRESIGRLRHRASWTAATIRRGRPVRTPIGPTRSHTGDQVVSGPGDRAWRSVEMLSTSANRRANAPRPAMAGDWSANRCRSVRDDGRNDRERRAVSKRWALNAVRCARFGAPKGPRTDD